MMHKVVAAEAAEALYPVVAVDDISGPILFPRFRSEVEWRSAPGRGDVLHRAVVGADGGVSIFLPWRDAGGVACPAEVYARRLPYGDWHLIYRVGHDAKGLDVCVPAGQVDA